jgi:hypothetical protein
VRYPTLDSGGYIQTMRCPTCAQPQEVYIVLGCRQTVDEEGGTLKPTLHAKAVDHVCQQRSLLDENVVDAVGTPTMFDPRQRAAGEHLG